jgi:PPOX class probable F420-dependent enzyme
LKTLDPATEGGAKALRRLETELMGWLTTVNPDGQPQSSPIWFLWREGGRFIFGPTKRNVVANAHVSFNLNTDPDGDDVVTMEGEARVDLSLPPSSADPSFQAKHRHMIDRYGWTPEWLAENYPVPIVITPTRWRLG